MGVSSDMRSSRVRRQAAKKPNKERTVQVRFSDEELAALDAICSEKKMTRSAFLRSCVEKVQGGDVEPTYVVTRNADAERMASEAKCIGVNVNQIARVLNAETKSHPGSLSPGVLTDNLSDLVSGADVIVIPVRPTPNDIEPFTRTVSIVTKNTNAPLVIVVNGTNRFRMCASFMAWLEKKPWAKNVVKVPQSEAIVQAQGMQKSVVNVDRHGAAAEAVRTMCRKVSVLAGLPFEKKQLKRIDTH